MTSKTPPVPRSTVPNQEIRVISVATPPAYYAAASDTGTWQTIPPDLVAAALEIQREWELNPPVQRSMKTIWDEWYTLQRSWPDSVVKTTLQHRVTRSKTAERLAGGSRFFFSREGQRAIDGAIPIVQNGRGMTLNDAYAHEKAFLNPTMETLATLKWSTELSLTQHVHYHNLYRVLKFIGSGSYGQVFANGIRTPEMDRGVLAILDQAGTLLTQEWRERLVAYLGSRFKITAMKESLVDASDLPREYAITQEAASILFPLGIKAVAAPYALKNWRDSDVYPAGLPTYSAFANPRDPNQRDTIALVRAATVESGDVATGHYKYQMHSQYIRGSPIELCTLTKEELNATYAYLHSVLAILWKKATLIHNDIHGGNVYLEGWGMGNRYVLPICDVDGNHLFSIELPFRPVLLDWGMACSAANNTYGVESSPRRSQLNDILGLYTGLHLRGLEIETIGYSHCKTYMGPFISEFAYQPLPGSPIDHLRSPPYGLVLPQVDHASFLQAYLDSGVLVPLMTSNVEQLSPNLYFSPSDPIAYAAIRADAERIRAAYYDDTFINASPMGDPRRFIRAYLKETIEFYSH